MVFFLPLVQATVSGHQVPLNPDDGSVSPRPPHPDPEEPTLKRLLMSNPGLLWQAAPSLPGARLGSNASFSPIVRYLFVFYAVIKAGSFWILAFGSWVQSSVTVTTTLSLSPQMALELRQPETPSPLESCDRT